ncbi:hypothetical protein C4K16_5706 [Pseudomonas chlororaphis subsp. aurantiaca]|nr:hypothetical protein C4K17_5971 [Pseudomonas chlororaphis subsp. aurantiaca]AZD76022.1 hypothetical protein C4K16_5706 [Pseudomonas chlororaphis subsp. aurantiaca]AZD82265.1 hypothetical protein C4K15_5742 [Pseudomonas chlororaphis subsp. aurantiaca]
MKLASGPDGKRGRLRCLAAGTLPEPAANVQTRFLKPV